MNNLKILSSITEEERFLVRHIIDLARQSSASGRSMSSAFLDERQLLIASLALDKEGYSDYQILGGYEGAHRQVIRFNGYGEEVPFSAVIFNYREADSLTHRDFLGALMSLNIKREMIGDILVSKGRTAVFVMNHVSEIVTQINKVGRVGVRISYDFGEGDIPRQQFESIQATVQSLRLDSCLSAALKLSRSRAQELIKVRGITLNHVEVFDASIRMAEQDVFSVRGEGKFILRKIGGLSKKDRIFITIDRFK